MCLAGGLFMLCFKKCFFFMVSRWPFKGFLIGNLLMVYVFLSFLARWKLDCQILEPFVDGPLHWDLGLGIQLASEKL